MRNVEIEFLEAFAKKRGVSFDDSQLLFSQPLGLATDAFLTVLHQNEIFKYHRDGRLWLLLDHYFKQSIEHRAELLLPIDHTLNKYPDENNTRPLKNTGTYLMVLSREIICQVYLSGDPLLIQLFEKYVPIPPARLFAKNTVPHAIRIREQEAQETIKKIALKTIEPFILKAQRHIRGKRRQQEERHRIQEVHAKQLNKRLITAAELMQDANTPYIPQCEPTLAQRIMNAAQTVSAFSTVKHITSTQTLQSVLDDALYGRRTLLDFYMTFNPAALQACDILNGDGNVVCLGPQDIDPKTSGSIIIEFDLAKLLATKPSAFYKQKDLEYLTADKIRHVTLGKHTLHFDHTGPVQYKSQENAYLKIVDKHGNIKQIASSLKSTLIAYDLERMHEILTLNFFRFIDKITDTDRTPDQRYIDKFYRKIARLNEDELVRFLTDIEKNMTDTAEFNFYGAHKINFSTINSIRDRNKDYTLQLSHFIESLNLGDLDQLRAARTYLPEVFQSYRFLDYLLSKTNHTLACYYLDDLRKQCTTPNWVSYTPLNTTDTCKIDWQMTAKSNNLASKSHVNLTAVPQTLFSHSHQASLPLNSDPQDNQFKLK